MQTFMHLNCRNPQCNQARNCFGKIVKALMYIYKTKHVSKKSYAAFYYNKFYIFSETIGLSGKFVPTNLHNLINVY